MDRAAHRVPAHLVWHMCYGNAREFDCVYPEVNAACLAKLFDSGRALGWHEIHLETARPGMARGGAAEQLARPRGDAARASASWR